MKERVTEPHRVPSGQPVQPREVPPHPEVDSSRDPASVKGQVGKRKRPEVTDHSFWSGPADFPL